MKYYIKIGNYINQYKILLLQYIPAVFLVFTIAFMLLRFPYITSRSISSGLNLCLTTLIPTLYPFMVLCSFFVNYNLCELCENVFSRITYFLFRLSGKCAPVILLSMIAGLPVGGKMTAALYENGKISKNEGQRLLLFCLCPGPAFVISTVGYSMLYSKSAGIIIYCCVVTSNLIIGCISSLFAEKNIKKNTIEPGYTSVNFSTALVKSVTEGSSNMLSVCSWVIIFSCIIGIVDVLPISQGSKLFACSILEITNGCLYAVENVPIPIICGIIAFGGLCGHFQIMSAIVKLQLKIKYFITARIINAGLAVMICNIILHFFPLSNEVFALGEKPQSFASGISKSISIAMLMMCVLFLLGDNFKIKIGKKKV